jgi:ABC-type protease/lipase transport system fused ATPase/permease subunit
MPSFLDAWAEREQRRVERSQAKPPKPLPFPRIFGAVERTFVTLVVAVRIITIPLFLVFIAVLLAQHTVPSVLLAVGLAMLLSLSVFNTSRLIQRRRENGQGWLTGRTLEDSN